MNKIKLESIFLIISLIFGVILVYFIPPFQSPDEDSHFKKAYQISKGNFFPHYVDGKYGYCIPNDMDDYIEDKLSYMGNYERKYNYSQMHIDQLVGVNYNDCTVRRISTDEITPIAHIIPALGIQMTDYLHSFDSHNKGVSVSVMLQFARLFCVIFYTLICYFAIKITPKFKKSFFVILLLPNVLFLRSAVTYDSLIISTCAISLAVMLKLYYDKKENFNMKYFIFFIISGYILLSLKTLYSIIFFLMVFMPITKFNNRKDKLIKYAEMISIVLVFYVLFRLPYLSAPSGYDNSLQMEFIKTHPFEFIGIIFSNIFGQLSSQLYFMNGTVGLLDTYMPVLHVFISYLLITIVFIIDSFTEDIKISIYVKIGYAVLLILAIFGIYTAMYVSWTPQILNVIGGDTVTGVQGRYYLPLLFIIPIIFNNSLITKIKNKNIIKKFYVIINNYTCIIPFTIIIQTIIMLFIILLRYYI